MRMVTASARFVFDHALQVQVRTVMGILVSMHSKKEHAETTCNRVLIECPGIQVQVRIRYGNFRVYVGTLFF